VSTADFGGCSMLDLFRMEAEAQAQVLTAGLLALERDAASAEQLAVCMRAAHSLKGAARIVGLDAGVRLAHAMEDCFVAAQEHRIALGSSSISVLLTATDLLVSLAQTDEDQLEAWTNGTEPRMVASLKDLTHVLEGTLAAGTSESAPAESPVETPEPGVTLAGPPAEAEAGAVSAQARDASDAVIRVTADNLNRLLGLASEARVESRWVKPFSESLLRLKRMQQESRTALDIVRSATSAAVLDERAQAAVERAFRMVQESQRFLSERLDELEMFDRRALNLSHRLYDEALACRMRPFVDGVQAFPRLVRDVARTLGKQVRLEIVGESTQVDRDVLARLDAPLGHLLRNAVDHGIEMPERRRAAGKPAEGVIRLEARHSAGALHVSISDDGCGIDLEKIREKVVARHLLNRDAAATLTDAELLEFLFLPGFTMKTTVTDISGRGVGLDVVQTMVKQVRGIVRVSSQPNQGTRFLLQLPVTLSVVRTLLADVGGEPYAFPLASIVRTLRLSRDRIDVLEGRQHFDLDGRRIGLVTAHQVLGLDPPSIDGPELSVVVLGDHGQSYGLVVDRFLGERELVVQRLDAQFGKLKDIAAGALMEDGSPMLIVDPADLIRSTDRLVLDGHLDKVSRPAQSASRKRKRVLVVDDSLTVREVERKLLVSRGYDVDVAVDGMDGWNAARAGDFDLVVTDIDMPRLDGIELVRLINGDARLKGRPVMIVSYKDRDEDRRRGLEAGAAYYLTKGSFHDDTLVQAVVDLIGEAAA
jgi:two-component system, chemotaxis family, sensor histidine kinase and response regulator WspE